MNVPDIAVVATVGGIIALAGGALLRQAVIRLKRWRRDRRERRVDDDGTPDASDEAEPQPGAPEERSPSVKWYVIRSLMGVLGLVAVGLLGYLMIRYLGIVTTVVYVLLFLVGITFFPLFIAMLGNQLPFSTLVGKLHILLGAFSYNHHYLVDLGDKWEWCPGDAERVYLDGKWHDIDGGLSNRSVLGWRPFGILRYKDDDTLADVRADTSAERARGATADGGTIERAGIEEIGPPAVSGIDGEWLLDLKRVFSRGVKKIGDIELVEKAEEVIERGEVTGGRLEGYRPIIGAIVGLLIGSSMGYVMFAT